MGDGTLFDIFSNEATDESEPRKRESLWIKGVTYFVMSRHIINPSPQPGEVYAELVLTRPRGSVNYAADEIYVESAVQSTGIAWLDEGLHPQPSYTYKLRPDREVSQPMGLGRKIEEKSPCCNRTMTRVLHGGFTSKFCRKCGKQVTIL